MRVNILPPAPPQMMEATVFAQPSVEMMAYINFRNADMMHRVENFYGQAGQDFIQQSNQFYQNYADSTGIEMAKAIAEMTDNALSPHSGVIVPLETVEALQTAHGEQLHYLMANPTMTQLYLDGRIDGYGELWVNKEGEAMGVDRDAYRAVTSCLGHSSYDPNVTEDMEETWTHHSHTLEDEGMPLSFRARVNIARSWLVQNNAIADNIDTSSIDGFEIRPDI